MPVFTSYTTTLTGILTWGCTMQITPSGGSLAQGFSTTQAMSGAAADTFGINEINITADDINTAAGQMVNGLLMYRHFGGAATVGGRQGIGIYQYLDSATNAANTNRNYVALYASSRATSSDGGASLAAPKGAIFGINPDVVLEAAAINMAEIAGGEFNVSCKAGSTVVYKAGMTITAGILDAVSGATYDCMLGLSNQAGAVGWNNGILIGNMNGAHPIKATGYILRALAGGTVANGIDIGDITVSTWAFRSPGFAVDGSGNAIAKSVRHTAVAFASLPAPVKGMVAMVTDATTNVWGAVVAGGGGANNVLVVYNGANWTVIGK